MRSLRLPVRGMHLHCTDHCPCLPQWFPSPLSVRSAEQTVWMTTPIASLCIGWSSLDRISGYVLPPNLTNITDNDQLVFRFQPTDRSALSTGIAMNVSMTIHLFGSSEYLFEIAPRKPDHHRLASEDRCLFSVSTSSYLESWLSCWKALPQRVDSGDQSYRSNISSTTPMRGTR